MFDFFDYYNLDPLLNIFIIITLLYKFFHHINVKTINSSFY